MPYCQCPICGKTFHLNVAMPIDAWYREHFPKHDPHLPAPATCHECFGEWEKSNRVADESASLPDATRLD